ncbi:MAG TPA: cytochrome P460 family protein [Blastocatellia bacterium]|nr:cytochrome P460 family protein [Blastocatellia bacterium]
MSKDSNRRHLGHAGSRLPQASIAAAVVLLSLTVRPWARPNGGIAYPADYRRWAVAKSTLVGPQSAFFATEGGIHHIYANEKAMEGYSSGKFLDGAILVYELLETKEVNGLTLEGRRRRVDVMVKEKQTYGETGGWGFASFTGDNRSDGTLSAERSAACFACHASRKDHDFVFSEFRK